MLQAGAEVFYKEWKGERSIKQAKRMESNNMP
jgi:hypothetical protein